MSVRYPNPIQAGNLVALVAPSSGVQPNMHDRLNAVISLLQARGLRVQEGSLLRRQCRGASGSAAERAKELMDALLDNEVAAVLPPWGGDLAIETLRLMDFEKLEMASPKWLSGFSDISTIQLPLLIRAKWASIHGPNLMQLPDAELSETSGTIFNAWLCGSGSTITQNSSDGSISHRLDGSTMPLSFSGRLVGGCLDSISRLAGSPYGDVQAFGQSCTRDGLIVYLENAELKPFELARALMGLRLAGWFDTAGGILIGRNAANESNASVDYSVNVAMAGALEGIECPVLIDVDIGHVGPQWSIVQGALGVVNWKDGKATLHQTLN